MKILTNKYKNLQFKSFVLKINSAYGKTWYGETLDNQVVVVDFFMDGVEIGKSSDLIGAKNSLEGVIELEEGEDIDEKTLFRVLKWSKIA